MPSSQSRKKKGRFFGFRNGVVFRTTTFNSGHRHNWRADMRETSISQNHSHKINLRNRMALPNTTGGHRHRLI